MSSDQPTRPNLEGAPPSSGPSSLKGLTMALGIEPAQPGQDSLLGCDIGGVTMVRLIAEGGMGRVYEGKQEKPNRTVAVKVMRPGLTSPSILKRFEYEAEVLGRLQHPGIAHIYSVGVHRMGNATVPYFVMEYIADAKTLTKYANDLKLPMRQRLDLFRSVCEAVAHGHQKGVIHRDLKPSNILVDGTGQPKVIDFGVARATDSDMALTTMQTDVGQLIGTLQYMSPEQFRADPNDIDVRSDVYALGVILYELLAGKMPYDVKKKAIHEVARTVQEDDPTPLSRLDRALKGDVAVIAGKCLEKERGRRYSSASELGSDIGRYLSGEPITASPPGLMGGIMRLARRHRAAALTTCVVLGTLLLAIVGISVFALRAERASTESQQQRVLATQARMNAERERDNAFQSRESEAQQRAIAVEESQKAKQAIYVESLVRLANALKNKEFSAAHSLHRIAFLAYKDAYHIDAGMPLALRLMQQLLGPEPLIVLRKPGAAVSAVAFSADNSLIATGLNNEPPVLWNASTGEMLRQLQSTPVRQGPEGLLDWILSCEQNTLAISFTADDQYVIAVSERGDLTVWSTASGERVKSFSLHGTRDAVAMFTEQLPSQTATTPSKKAIEALVNQRLSEKNACASLSLDGTRCAWWAGHGDVSVWDIATAKHLSSIAPPPEDKNSELSDMPALSALAFSADGTRVLLSTLASLHVHDANTGSQILSLDDAEPASVVLTPDNARLVGVRRGGSDRVLCSWDASRADTPNTIATLADGSFSGHATAAAISDDGLRFALATSDHRGIVVFGLADKAMLARMEDHNGNSVAMTFSSDGRRLATAHGDKGVCVWDASQDERPTRLTGHSAGVSCICFSVSGDRIATGAIDGSIRIWDAATNEMLATLRGHPSAILQLAFSPDEACLASLSVEGLGIWDVVTGNPLEPCIDLKGAFATDLASGHCRVAAASDGCLALMDAFTSRLIAEVKQYTEPVRAMAYDSLFSRVAIASSKGPVRIFDTRADSDATSLDSSAYLVEALDFSPSGTLLATASKQGTRLWDVTSGACRASLSDSPSTLVAFSPNEAYVAASEVDLADSYLNGVSDQPASVGIWNVATGARLASTKGRERSGQNAITPLRSYRNLQKRQELFPLMSNMEELRSLIAAKDQVGMRAYEQRSKLQQRLHNFFSTKTIMAFAPDSQLLLFGTSGDLQIVDCVRGDALADLLEPGPPTCAAFHPAAMSLGIGSIASTDVQMYGVSSDDIRGRRLAAANIRARLSSQVGEWCEQGMAVAKERLAAAKRLMSPEDFREASNLVLSRAALEQREGPSIRLVPLAVSSPAPASGIAAPVKASPGIEAECDGVSGVWKRLFHKHFPAPYSPPTLIVFEGSVESPCATRGAAAGTFYCPLEKKVYVDLFFHEELKRRSGAPGGFANAYVIAHLFGHHVQNLLGITAKVESLRRRLSERDFNKLVVRLEMQADFLAGVWAHHVGRYAGTLREEDIQDAVTIAGAISDERIAKQAGDEVFPDALSHGTREQRVSWFRYGLTTGDPTLMDRAFEKDEP
jgi:predicted metalloprotease/WD40 repeat protein/tRNA A-37 threonylcarbamoyl transferase component Bud32